MKGIKLEILGIGIILLGIVLSLDNFFGYMLGLLGIIPVLAGYIRDDKSN